MSSRKELLRLKLRQNIEKYADINFPERKKKKRKRESREKHEQAPMPSAIPAESNPAPLFIPGLNSAEDVSLPAIGMNPMPSAAAGSMANIEMFGEYAGDYVTPKRRSDKYYERLAQRVHSKQTVNFELMKRKSKSASEYLNRPVAYDETWETVDRGKEKRRRKGGVSPVPKPIPLRAPPPLQLPDIDVPYEPLESAKTIPLPEGTLAVPYKPLKSAKTIPIPEGILATPYEFLDSAKTVPVPEGIIGFQDQLIPYEPLLSHKSLAMPLLPLGGIRNIPEYSFHQPPTTLHGVLPPNLFESGDMGMASSIHIPDNYGFDANDQRDDLIVNLEPADIVMIERNPPAPAAAIVIPDEEPQQQEASNDVTMEEAAAVAPPQVPAPPQAAAVEQQQEQPQKQPQKRLEEMSMQELKEAFRGRKERRRPKFKNRELTEDQLKAAQRDRKQEEEKAKAKIKESAVGDVRNMKMKEVPDRDTYMRPSSPPIAPPNQQESEYQQQQSQPPPQPYGDPTLAYVSNITDFNYVPDAVTTADDVWATASTPSAAPLGSLGFYAGGGAAAAAPVAPLPPITTTNVAPPPAAALLSRRGKRAIFQDWGISEQQQRQPQEQKKKGSAPAAGALPPLLSSLMTGEEAPRSARPRAQAAAAGAGVVEPLPPPPPAISKSAVAPLRIPPLPSKPSTGGGGGGGGRSSKTLPPGTQAPRWVPDALKEIWAAGIFAGTMATSLPSVLQGAAQGKGFVYPGSHWIGPKNPMEAEGNAAPTSQMDELARIHDHQYGELLSKGKNPYFTFNEADKYMLDHVDLSTAEGWAIKFFIGAKQHLFKEDTTPVSPVPSYEEEVAKAAAATTSEDAHPLPESSKHLQLLDHPKAVQAKYKMIQVILKGVKQAAVANKNKSPGSERTPLEQHVQNLTDLLRGFGKMTKNPFMFLGGGSVNGVGSSVPSPLNRPTTTTVATPPRPPSLIQQAINAASNIFQNMKPRTAAAGVAAAANQPLRRLFASGGAVAAGGKRSVTAAAPAPVSAEMNQQQQQKRQPLSYLPLLGTPPTNADLLAISGVSAEKHATSKWTGGSMRDYSTESFKSISYGGGGGDIPAFVNFRK